MDEQKIRYYDFGEFRLDAKRRDLSKTGEKISLTGRNFDLLLVLVQSGGRILDHEELLDKVWGETFVEQSNLKKGISSLRQILGEKPNESLYIKTIPRRGYSFVAEVSTGFDDAAFFNTGEIAALKPETNGNLEKVEQIPTEKVEKIEELEQSEQSEPLKVENIAPASTDSTPKSQGFLGKYKIGILAVACLLIFSILFFGFKYFRQGNVSARDFRLENLKIQKMTTGGNVVEAAISPDGKTIVYATMGENKQQTLSVKRVGASNAQQIVTAGNVEYNYITVSPDNNFIYYSAAPENSKTFLYKISISGGASRKISENISSAVTFSPDGKKIAFLRDPDNLSRVLLIADSEDGGDEKEVRRVSDNHTMIAPIWSPDGKNIAFVSSRPTDKGRIWAIHEVSADGGEPHEIVAARKGKIYLFDWTKDGKSLIICADPNDSQQSQMWVAAYPNGEMTRLTNDILTYQGANLSADGNSILTIQKERTGDLFYMNYSLLQNTERLTETQSFMGRFTVTSDNRILAEINENGRRGLAFVGIDGSNLQQLFSQNANEQSPSVSPDEKNIYFVSTRSGTSEIWESDIEGRNAKQLTDEKTFVITPNLSPDKKYVYFGMYDGIRWRLARIPVSGGKPEYVSDETFGAFGFSPDGNFLAYSCYDAQNKKWRIIVKKYADNSVVKEFDAAAFDFVSWTPDSKNLIYILPEVIREGGSLWLQPLENGSSKLILNAKEDKILWADWSPDGQKLYLTKGKTISNIVLINKESQN